MNAIPDNLPIPLSSFIGREKEIAEVKRLIAGTRLLTLTGSGGTGKTRLALEAARELSSTFADGAWFIDLASLDDPAQITRTVATALQLREHRDRATGEILVDYLRSKIVLLLLDNCEHLTEASAQLSDSLLRACPQLKILATSREPLNLVGETNFRVPSLSAPDPDHMPPLDTLTQYEAVRLFAARALAANSSFNLSKRNASAVAQICSRLDGIPLAIELAAARVRIVPPEIIAARLNDRFRLLTEGNRTALPRQQTLRGALDWSFNLLTEAERVLMRRLSVFAGGWALDAAEAICAGEALARGDVLDLLTHLVDKSLVETYERGETTRCRMLETIRQYAREKLVESGEDEQVHDRHLAFFLNLAEVADMNLHGAQQMRWLDRLELEHDNCRAAFAWSDTERADAETGLRLAGALWYLWEVRGHVSEGRERLANTLAHPDVATSRTAAKARGLTVAGRLALVQGDFASAQRLFEESRAIWQAHGAAGQWGMALALMGLGRVAFRSNRYAGSWTLYEESLSIFRQLGSAGRWGAAESLMGLGSVASAQGDYDGAQAFYEESMTVSRELGDKIGVAASLKYLGDVAYRQGDYARTATLSEESLALSTELGDKGNIIMSLIHLGDVACRQGDYDQAMALFERSLAICRESGVKGSMVISLNNMGAVALARGNLSRAMKLYEESLALARELGGKWDIGGCLEGIAGLAVQRGQYERAAVLLGAVEGLFEGIGFRVRADDRADHEHKVAVVRGQLKEEIFTDALARGRALSIEQVIDEAQRATLMPAHGPAPVSIVESVPATELDALTRRELEVLRLVAKGLTDGQVADLLVISRRTVGGHLSSIYSKLDVTTRTAATRYALEHKLV